MSAWSRTARLYDLQRPLERAALRALAEMLELGPQRRLLDVGTGTGALLATVAAADASPATALGVDSSAEMLAHVPALPVGWETRLADATDVPAPDGAFDRVTAAYLLHLLGATERLAVLTELRRVTEAGGLLGTVTVAPPNGSVERVVRGPVTAAAQRSDGVASGLRPLDPLPDLEATGWRALRGRRLRRGYPSLCVVAAAV